MTGLPETKKKKKKAVQELRGARAALGTEFPGLPLTAAIMGSPRLMTQPFFPLLGLLLPCTLGLLSASADSELVMRLL